MRGNSDSGRDHACGGVSSVHGQPVLPGGGAGSSSRRGQRKRTPLAIRGGQFAGADGFGSRLSAENGIFHRKIIPTSIPARRINRVRLQILYQRREMLLAVSIEDDIRERKIQSVHRQYAVIRQKNAA